MSTFLALLSLAGAIAAQQQQYLPWEQQTDVGSIPAWYAPKTAGFAAQAGSAMNVAPPLGSPFPSSSSFAARPSYPPNFPGYPTFGTVQPVGPSSASKSGGNPYSTTYKPKTTTGFRPKPSGGRSNLDKYLPLMKKKKAMTTTTTMKTTVRPTAAITKRRKLPAKKTTTRPTSRPTTTVRPTTTTVKTTTTTADSTEWESLEVVEKTSSTMKPTTSTLKTTTTEKRPKEEKEDRKRAELVKGPIVQKGRPEKALPPSTTPTTKSRKSSEEEEDKEAEFNLLGFLWDKSELLASIKNMIKQLKSSIDEAGLEEDVKQVSDHLKNTIKGFASASPVNEQLGRLFERAQNADVNKLE
ncbi:hypothetical protein PRIPAC_70996 [Pristionchus pacificus]|uniref:Uncharacterized protein n=1 Tax=Pristionchus pacificus TaxID=54126 RepID=A0A2A6C7A0_PRIPA|nr:hypothetical protein PRIPAC_70996 [Pristionchus pacificus]|eukprot:PDM73933.1 hypothetical protein PRIPAC_41289 [Pristionchus pacificus]